jgi:thiol-disulfide isomerase/thioredoxin
MSVFSTRRRLKVSVIAFLAICAIALVSFYANRNPADIRSFLTIRYKWDRTTPKTTQEEFAKQCLELADKYPNTTGELSALYLAACRAPKTEAGQKARELFITRIADADLSKLDRAIRYSHVGGEWNVLTETQPDPQAIWYYYHVYRDQGIVVALLERLKQSRNHPHTAALLAMVCEMSSDRDSEEPTAQFGEAAVLIVSAYVASPDIYNFCEILGNMSGYSPPWAAKYESHLRTILKVNQTRFVRCAAMMALASVLQLPGESREAEAKKLYEEFLTKFDGQQQYPFQGIEQQYRQMAQKHIERLRMCGIGKPAMEITGVDLAGQPMKLSEYRGKVVLLSFWATWCNPCMKLIPHERAIATRLEGKPFAIVGVSGDTDDVAIKKALTTHNITWRSFHDRQLNKAAISDQWNVIGWPTLYLIDDKGIIRATWHDDRNLEEMNRTIDQLLAAVPLSR